MPCASLVGCVPIPSPSVSVRPNVARLDAPRAVWSGDRVGKATPIPTAEVSVAAYARAASTNASHPGTSAEETWETPTSSASLQSSNHSRDELLKARE